MVVLVDTNVVIDFPTTRKLFYEASSEVIMKCAGEDVVKAIGMKDFKYFEDCLQDRCAESIDADYINEYAKAESSVLIYL